MWRLSARYTSAYPTFIERGRYIPSLSIHLTFCCVFLLFAVATYLTARQCFRNLIRNFAKLKCRLSNRHFQYFFSSSWSAAALVYRLPVSFIILLLSSSIHVSMFMFFCVRVCFISLICSLNCRTHTTKRWSMCESSVRMQQRSMHSEFVVLRRGERLRRLVRWEGTLPRYVTTSSRKLINKNSMGCWNYFAGYSFLLYIPSRPECVF